MKNMRLFPAIVLSTNSEGKLTVKDKFSDIQREGCVVIRQDPSNATDYLPLSEVIVLEYDYTSYVLGRVDNPANIIMTETGERIYLLSNKRAIIGYQNGKCGIYNFYLNEETRDFKAFPVLEFDKDNVLTIISSGKKESCANTISKSISIDKLGYVHDIDMVRGNSNDVAPKYIKEKSGSPLGYSEKSYRFISPAPYESVPIPSATYPVLPLTLYKEISSTQPYMIKYTLAPGVCSTIAINLDGSIDISNALGGVSISALGEIKVKNKLSSINIDPKGKIEVSGLTGLDLKGTAGVSLIDVLMELTTVLSTMTVGTAVGPSTPPIQAAAITAIQNKLNILKGV